MKYFVNRVQFDDLATVLKIYKRQKKSLMEVLRLFSNEENRKKVQTLYPKISPITVKEALSFANTEQRMTAMQFIDIEEIVEELEAVCVDKQTVTKKQTRWNTQAKPYEHIYNDTYELYKIQGEKMGLKKTWRGTPDLFFVKCTCASTAKQFYLYVPSEIGEKKDAITAIAWTMPFQGKHLTKEQYMDYMYSET